MFGVQTLSSVCKQWVQSANTYVQSTNPHVWSANAEFGLQTMSSVCEYSRLVCESSRSECPHVRSPNADQSANNHVWSPNTDFGLWTFTFGVQTLSSVCKHWVRSANTHVVSPNTKFGLRTFTFGVQTLSLVCEPSRSELRTWISCNCVRIYVYSGTSIIRTLLGPHQTVLIIEVSLVQRLVHNTAVMLLYLVDTIKYSTYKQDIRVKVNFCL